MFCKTLFTFGTEEQYNLKLLSNSFSVSSSTVVDIIPGSWKSFLSCLSYLIIQSNQIKVIWIRPQRSIEKELHII